MSFNGTPSEDSKILLKKKKERRSGAGGGRELGYRMLTLKLKRTHVGKYVTQSKGWNRKVDQARRRKSAKQRVTLLKSFW